MKIKVLFISMLPPLKSSKTAGEQTFCYYFNKFASDESFDVKLITCAFYNDKKNIDNELSTIDKKIIYWDNPSENKIKKLINIESKFNLFNRNANLISNTTEYNIINFIKEFIDNGYVPDVIILEWTEMVVLAKRIKLLFPYISLVASEHDVVFIGYERKKKYYSGIKKLWWTVKYIQEKKVELTALNKCDLILPHNYTNKEVLEKNGISGIKIQGITPFFHNMNSIKREIIGKQILFFGALNRIENSLSVEWFIKKVLPKLKDLDVTFVVLGGNPTKEILNYESERVHFTGFVNDIIPYFSQSMCFVAPLVLGAGIKVKILEALSSGIPVLTNNIGIEGISAKKSLEYIHCEEAEEYEYAIRKIYYHKEDAEYIGAMGKAFMKKNYSLESSFSNYKGMIFNLVKSKII